MNSEKVLSFFKEITAVPRESGNPDLIVAYLVNFAKARGLEYKVDEVKNVVIIKPASPERAGEPTIVLQSHSDMVCEKTPSSTHNFLTDPIPYIIEDGWMVAPETTLGADCGIGMATALALLDSDLSLPRLECLFTCDEETGMDGAFGLQEGTITGKTLINLDSEDEGEIFIGCAGGIDTLIDYHFQKVAPQPGYAFVKFTLGGFIGGHSGDEINKHRANAVQLMARFLYSAGPEALLAEFNGGGRVNAIARDSEAIVAVPAEAKPVLLATFEEFVKEVKGEYKNETKFVYAAEEVAPCNTLTAAQTRPFVSAMFSAPHGPWEYSLDIPGLVETSTNLASVRTLADRFHVETSQRSSIVSAKLALSQKVASIFRLIGADVVIEGEYPGWEPNVKSPLLAKSVDVYKQCFSEDPKVKAIHAGLECGLFLTNFPDLDMISVGPTLRGVHAPGERLDLASLDKFVTFISALLA